jgi:hypothetical protein
MFIFFIIIIIYFIRKNKKKTKNKIESALPYASWIRVWDLQTSNTTSKSQLKKERKRKKNQQSVEIFQKRKDCQQKMRCGSKCEPYFQC